MATGYVRPARAGDAADIARIQLTTWRVAYRGLLPQRALDQLDEGWLARGWHEAITAPPSPAHRVLVAVEQAERAPDGGPGTAYLVGFAAAGPADPAALAPGEESLPAGTAAVTELLVEPRWGRRGHGSRLLAACVAGWQQDGLRAAVAWAYRDDPATRRFLTSAGWAPDGATRALDVDDQLIPQVRVHTALPDDGLPTTG
jgi:GNAT superfamily N-acetyltransferase